MNKDKKDILNEKDVIDENTINDDVILSEAKDLADDEIKDMFDEEFDLAGITVSEELIAKTMTAIRGLSEEKPVEFFADTDIAGKEAADITRAAKTTVASETTESSVKATEQSETSNTSDKIVSISKGKRAMKLVSGLAAALFIGVVVFAFLKMGVGGITKSNDSSAEAPREQTVNTPPPDIALESANNHYKAEANTADSPQSYANIPVIPSEHATESLNTHESIDAVSDNSNDPIVSAGDGGSDYTDEVKNIVDNEDDGKYNKYLGILNANAKNISDITEVKEYIELKSYKVAQSVNIYLTPMAKNIPVIRSSDIYEEVLEEVDPITEEALYALLRDSEDDPAREYVYALMLQDVSGIVFDEDETGKTWTTGKEYLEFYEAALENSKDE